MNSFRTPRPNVEREQQRRALAEQRRRRLTFVYAIVFGIFLLLGGRLYHWQILNATMLKSEVYQPIEEVEDIKPRGTIRDRNGYMLAVDGVEYNLAASTNIIANPEEMAEAVGGIIGLSSAEIEELEETFRGSELYVPITTSLPYTVGQELIALDSGALKVMKKLRRHYPNGSLAAHILGFVNAGREGHYGIESYYEDVLLRRDPPGQTLFAAAEEVKLGARPFAPTRDGVDLVLTIDRAIQFIVEQELQKAIVTYGAERGTIIVLDPETGDILAMANYPTFNPNDYATTPAELFSNPAVEQQYEPGSVFKIITAAAALDAGVITPDTIYTDTGVIEVGGQYIRNWNGAGNGPQTVTGILGLSLNTGTAYLATLLGADRQLRYYEEFGFGQRTGVDLGGEVAGQLKRYGDGLWHPSDLGTNAFGQGIGVTPLQMISAVAAVINDGQLMRPRVVKAIIDHGVVHEIPPVKRGQPIRPETAALMRRILANAVEVEAHEWTLDDWRIGGKTGTAQVPIPGGYHATDTIASFIGFAPADDPKFVMLVKLDKPPGPYMWGSTSAAPTFKVLARRLLDYWSIPPDRFRLAEAAEQNEFAP